MGRREEKKEATRQEILSAAAELFRTKGYDTTSVDDIVLAANLAKGTFYYHFQKKDDLVMALQELELQKAASHARNQLARGASPCKVLVDFVSETAHWTEANSELTKALIKQKFEHIKSDCTAEKHGPPPAVKAFFIDLIIEIIVSAQLAGEIRNDMKASELAQVVIPVIMSARMSWLFHEDGSLAFRMERSMRILFEGLQNTQGK